MQRREELAREERCWVLSSVGEGKPFVVPAQALKAELRKHVHKMIG